MRVDAAAIARAARRLKAEGRAVSTRAVRDVTGGDLRDIAPVVAQWRADRARESEALSDAGPGAGGAAGSMPQADPGAGDSDGAARSLTRAQDALAETDAGLGAHVAAAADVAQRAALEIGRLRDTVSELAAALRDVQGALARLREDGRGEPTDRRTDAERPLEGEEPAEGVRAPD